MIEEMAEFMSSVDLEHSKSYVLKFASFVKINDYLIFTYSFSKTEIWSFDKNDDTVNIKMAEPDLDDYRYYPELQIVDSDFCTRK